MPGFVAAYVEAFESNPEMAAAGGPVYPEWEVPPPEWLLRMATADTICIPFSLMDLGDEAMLSAEGFFFSNNMAIRKGTLFELGGFNPESFGANGWVMGKRVST